MSTHTCKKCGDTFTPSKEEVEMYEDGHTPRPELCDECLELLNNKCFDEDSQLSDVDNGL
ncbi:MAG: hypothetical protein IPO78_17215 [Saprospiraceae bacterium]|nr:hypothetical protein [Saprospiraceae bacterium]